MQVSKTQSHDYFLRRGWEKHFSSFFSWDTSRNHSCKFLSQMNQLRRERRCRWVRVEEERFGRNSTERKGDGKWAVPPHPQECAGHTQFPINSEYCCIPPWSSPGFPSGSVVKNLPANAQDVRDALSNPGLGRSPGGEHDFSILAWEIPWTEEPGRLQSTKNQTQLSTHTWWSSLCLIFSRNFSFTPTMWADTRISLASLLYPISRSAD